MTREQHAQRQEQADMSQCLVCIGTSKRCNHAKGLGFCDSEEAVARL